MGLLGGALGAVVFLRAGDEHQVDECQDADIKLLAKAGVQVGQGRILHFYTPETENRLAVVERNFANRKAKMEWDLAWFEKYLK